MIKSHRIICAGERNLIQQYDTIQENHYSKVQNNMVDS